MSANYYRIEVRWTAIQVFASSPRTWATSAPNPAMDEAFKSKIAEHNIEAYVHASFLINLGSPTQSTYENSLSATAYSLKRGKEIGAQGVVVHTGSAVDESRLSPLRSGIVNMRALASIAREFELGSALKIGKGEEVTGGRDKNSILADAFEALVGAIYLDHGFDVSAEIIMRLSRSSDWMPDRKNSSARSSDRSSFRGSSRLRSHGEFHLSRMRFKKDFS